MTLSSPDIPIEQLEALRAEARGDYPNDYSTQLFVLHEQVDSSKKLRSFSAPDIALEKISRVREKAAADHPHDYSTQLYLVRTQIDAFHELNNSAAE